MSKIKKYAYLCPIIIGIVLILIGVLIKVPGTALTTYQTLDGSATDSAYYIDNRYSSIDEYVGGDAYNYIIGASLVAGRISDIITEKAVFIAAGALCLCAGLTLVLLSEKRALAELPVCSEEGTAPKMISEDVESNTPEM